MKYIFAKMHLIRLKVLPSETFIPGRGGGR